MIENPYVLLLVFPLVAYVIGSTPFGVLIARAHKIDLRKQGSGNVGATNVGRVLGRKWGYICFLLDVGKGLVPALLASGLVHPEQGSPSVLQQFTWLSVGAGAILGHIFSFWLKFRGGKGVATSLGVVLGIHPYFTLPGLCAFGLWIAVTGISRYVSLGSIVAATAFVPLFMAFRWWEMKELWPLELFGALMAGLIIYRHRSNISRLLQGSENKISGKKRENG